MATNAFQTGWQAASSRNAERRERKQALSDEERQLHVSDLYAKGQALSKLIPSLSGEQRDTAMRQLTDIEQGIRSIYHPDNNPGAVQKDWHLLTGLITGKLLGKKSQPAQPRIATATEPGVSGADIQVPVAPMSSGGSGLAALTLPASTQSIAMPGIPATKTSRDVGPMTPQLARTMAQRNKAREAAEQDVVAAGLIDVGQIFTAVGLRLFFRTQLRVNFLPLSILAAVAVSRGGMMR